MVQFIAPDIRLIGERMKPITSRTVAITAALLIFISTGISDDKPKPYIGISHRIEKDLPEIEELKSVQAGIRIIGVQPDSPAEIAELIEDDIIVGAGGNMFLMDADSVGGFFSGLLSKKHPGEVFELTILRMVASKVLEVDGVPENPDIFINDAQNYLSELPEEKQLNLSFSKEWKIETIQLILGIRNEAKLPPLPAISGTELGVLLSRQRVDYLNREKTIEWNSIIEETVGRYEFEEEYDDLRDRLRKIEDGNDGFRLTAVAAVHRDPLLLEVYSRSFTEAIYEDLKLSADQSDVCRISSIFLTSEMIDGSQSELNNLSEKADTSGFKRWFETHLDRIAQEFYSAFDGIEEEERRFTQEYRHDLSNAFAEQIYIHADDDKIRLQRNRRLIEIGQKLDLKTLLRSGSKAWQFVSGTSSSVLGWMDENPTVRSLETKWGKIGFGTLGRDRWDKADYMFIYDPGGDDFYADGCAAVDTLNRPFSFVVDISGNDAYQSTSEGAQGYGSLGIGIIFDRDGDDTYIGGRWSQGAGYFGVGLLYDLAGDDRYFSTEFSQGSGLFGFGALADISGDDQYISTVHSQGVGFTKGLGILADVSGNDNGYCTGKKPTNYGDAGIFDAWAQGCGMGFRSISSGGIGLLVDGDGEDNWEAGNFSQGGGYYYGLGIFHAFGKEDDTYMGSRYGQGFSAHQAAGAFIEDGGDDKYSTRQGVVSGLAWDQCLSLFIDDSGNDHYYGGSFFSLGASAHNSICLFLDRSGIDVYDYKPGPARAGGNKYHGGSSFSLFLDLGDDIDTYSSDKANNDVEISRPEYGVFRDGKGIQ